MKKLVAMAISASIIFSTASAQACSCSVNNRRVQIGLKINYDQCMAIAARAISSTAVDNVRQEGTGFYASAGERTPVSIGCVGVGEQSAVSIATEALNQNDSFIEAVQRRMKSFFDGYGVDDR